MEKEVFDDAALDAAIQNEVAREDEEKAEADAQIKAEAMASAPPVLSSDEFFAFFKSCFSAGSAMTGLQSLVIQDDEAGARLASDKLYNVIAANSVLRRLIENGGLLCLDWFIILSWAGKKAVACVAERAGTDTAGAVQKIAEKAGDSFAGGVLKRLMFWRRK